MDLWLFADDEIGMHTLTYIMKSFPNDISLVVTMDETSIYDRALSYNLHTVLYDDLESFLHLSKKNFPDLGMMAWGPKIITQELIVSARKGFVNTHPSYLPYNRGKNCNFWALVEECPFGVSIHSVVAEVDAGSIIAQSPIVYDWTDTGETLYHKAKAAMIDLIEKTYPILRELDWYEKKQNLDDGAFHLAREMEEASRIDLDKTYKARNLLNLLRARTFSGHPACWFEDDDEQYEVRVSISKKP